MPKKQESLNVDLDRLLKRFRPVKRNSAGKEVPVADEADVFQFPLIVDGENYGTVTVTIDGLHQLVVYYSEETAKSPNFSENGDITLTKLKKILKNFAMDNQLSFKLDNMDNLEGDMAKREHTRKLDEGYHPMGKKASYNDSVPTCKIILKHNKTMSEDEQRFRHVEKIFIENMQGERFLAPTVKPGVARLYARHIAEGGRPYDDRWNHLNSLVEEYTKMAGFVRATRGNQFNEEAQRLVNEGVNHYLSLRESLHKLTTHKGYNNYFESWTPPLMETEETTDLSSMFVTNSLDPRIESALPFLNKLSKNLQETVSAVSEADMFEQWANEVLENSLRPTTPAQQDELFKVLNKEKLPLGPDASNAKNELSNLIHDDELFDKLEKEAKLDSNADAKEAIISYMSNKPEYKSTIDKLNQKVQQPQQEEVIEPQPSPEPVDIPVSETELTPVPSGNKGLNPQQKKAGQLGPTEKVSTGHILGHPLQSQKGLRGKLVGAESVDPLLRFKKLSGLE